MKKRLILLVVLLAVGLICVGATVWRLLGDRGDHTPNPIRPKDFPQILVAPEKAVLVDHATAWDGRCVPHVYDLCFFVRDPYPSEDTYNLIEEHLSSKGWQRLKYQLLYPQQPPRCAGEVPQFLDPEMVDMLFQKGEQKSEYPAIYRSEDWVDKNEASISVLMYYSADLGTRRIDRDKVYVNLTLFEQQSWIHPYVVRYKELHPEEFEESRGAGEGGYQGNELNGQRIEFSCRQIGWHGR